MKTNISNLKLVMMLTVMLTMAHGAFAFYDANLGRWINRDPLGDLGFRTVTSKGSRASLDGRNLYVFVRNSPIQRVDSFGLRSVSCRCGEPLTQIGAVGPIDANTARRLANEALDAARRLAPSLPGGTVGLHNGAADAFRHCFWSCRMAQEIGVNQAETVGDIHEACGKNPPDEERMDQVNNGIGRQFGGISSGNCHDSCQRAATDGTLQTSPHGEPGNNNYYYGVDYYYYY